MIIGWIALVLVFVFFIGAIVFQRKLKKQPIGSKATTLFALMLASTIASVISLITALAILLHKHPLHKSPTQTAGGLRAQ